MKSPALTPESLPTELMMIGLSADTAIASATNTCAWVVLWS